MKKQGLMIFVLITVVVVLIAGCAPQTATPAVTAPATPAAPKVLKIGSMWPLSGPGALWGMPCRNVMQFQTEPVSYTHLTLPTNREV